MSKSTNAVTVTERAEAANADALALALAEAVEAFRDTQAVFRQGRAINADVFAGMKPADVTAAIAEARVRDRFPVTTWKPNADGTGPGTYREAVTVTARGAAFTASVSPASVEKHRAAWSLITDALVPHTDPEAYGDAFLVTRFPGGIGAARKGTAAIAAKPLEERAAAFRALADSIIPTRAAKSAAAKEEAAAKRAKAKEEAEAAEAKAASMKPAERIAAILAGALRTEDAERALSAEDCAAIAAVLQGVTRDMEAKAAERVSATGTPVTA